MELKNKLTDCVVPDFVTTIKTLYNYYEDAYTDDAEGIYCVSSDEDFKALWDEYGLENAVKLYNENKDGYVIAGSNVFFECIIKINKDNHAEILASFAGMIEDRIICLYEAGCPIDEIKKCYPTINVHKMIVGSRYEVETITTSWSNAIGWEYEKKMSHKDKLNKVYNNVNDCIDAIHKDIAKKVDSFSNEKEFHYEVIRCESTIVFKNITFNEQVVYMPKVVD